MVKHTRRKVHSLTTLTTQLLAVMPAEVAATSQDLHVAFLLDCMILPRWPDVELFDSLAFGFQLSGRLDRPHIFRSAKPSRGFQSRGSLLRGSEAFIDKLELRLRRCKDPEQSQALREQTLKGVLKFCSEPMTREAMRQRYGRGRWRPMGRFVSWQEPNSKWRAIGDAHFPAITTQSPLPPALILLTWLGSLLWLSAFDRRLPRDRIAQIRRPCPVSMRAVMTRSQPTAGKGCGSRTGA